MRYLVEFPLEDSDGSVIFEVDDVMLDDGIAPAGRKRERNIISAQETLEAAVDRIKPAAEVIIRKLANLTQMPDEIEAEFGIKLTAEAGAIIASTSAEVHYKITLKWKRESG